LSEDPAGFRGGINLFAYVDNGPTLYVDPSGLKRRPPFKGQRTGPPPVPRIGPTKGPHMGPAPRSGTRPPVSGGPGIGPARGRRTQPSVGPGSQHTSAGDAQINGIAAAVSARAAGLNDPLELPRLLQSGRLLRCRRGSGVIR